MKKLKRGTRDFAKSKSSVSVASAPWDAGATGRANGHNLVVEEAAEIDPESGEVINPNGLKRMRRVDMLEVWHKNGTITADGYTAAEKLRSAFEATQRAPGWPDNDRVQSSPRADHAITIQIDRLASFTAIMRLVIPEDRQVIDACILHGHSPAAIITSDGRKPYCGQRHNDGLLHVRSALDRLAAAMQIPPLIHQQHQRSM